MKLVIVIVGVLSATYGVCDVRLKGYLGERLDAMIEGHVCGTDVLCASCGHRRIDAK